jgi:hypothetical protein
LDLGVEVVTVYAFSIENFKRPAEEVETLMRLAKDKFLYVAHQFVWHAGPLVRSSCAMVARFAGCSLDGVVRGDAGTFSRGSFALPLTNTWFFRHAVDEHICT